MDDLGKRLRGRATAVRYTADNYTVGFDNKEHIKGAAELMEAAADALEAAARLSATPAIEAAVMGEREHPKRWTHVGRGGAYTEIGRGRMQTSEPLPDMADVVIYRSEDDGSLWVRPVAEFEDGRFAALAAMKGEGDG